MKGIVKNRFLLLLAAVLVISFTSLSLFNYSNARQALYEDLPSSTLPLLRDHIYTEVQKEYLPLLRVSTMLSRDSFLIDWLKKTEGSEDQLSGYLKDINKEFGFYSLLLVDSERSIQHKTNQESVLLNPENDSHRWYYRFLSSGEPYAVFVESDKAYGDHITIFIVQRIEDSQGKLIGVTGIGAVMSDFSSFLKEMQEKYHRKIYLVDEWGLIQAHSETQHLEYTNLIYREGLEHWMDDLLTPRSGPINRIYRNGNKKMFIYSQYIPDFRWFLIVELDEAVALRSARENLIRTLFIGLASIVLILTVASVAFRYFVGEMEILATTDPLTEAANRRAFDHYFNQEYSRFLRNMIPLSLIIIDIDLFKNINDTLGHARGDEVLIHLCKIVEEEKRPHDLLARWGGDEFVVLMEASEKEAESLARRIKSRLDSDIQSTTVYTISVGIASLEAGEESEELLNKADQALYHSKENGRNQISIYSDLKKLPAIGVEPIRP